MNIDVNPKYNLNQIVKFKILGIDSLVKITKRLAVCGIDTGKTEYYYDLRHDIVKGWEFDSVEEAIIDQYNV